MVECKPKKLWNTPLIKLKSKAAIKFCKENKLKYKLIDTIKISIDEIKILHESKKIKFIERYEVKFKELIK